MIHLLLFLSIFAPLTAPPPRYASIQPGIAKYYRPGLFARVAAVRGIPLRSDVDGYASTPDPALIGKVIHASIAGGPIESFQVLDSSAPRDRSRHLRERLVIEVDYLTARRHHFISTGHAPAVVYIPAIAMQQPESGAKP
ncbi:MAG: hypothetical protein IVW51_17600 [Thermaceae bacterium]|nr:hypothetical protein [Thermaceae bacterium]